MLVPKVGLFLTRFLYSDRESTKIIAKVNTANVTSKEVTKSVTIMTNTTPSTKVLIIKAKIK